MVLSGGYEQPWEPFLWFKAEEIPYALALLIAVLGWCVIRVIDEVRRLPTANQTTSRQKIVPSSQFDHGVRSYQAKQGLEEMGKLDYKTLTKASGTNAVQLLSPLRK